MTHFYGQKLCVLSTHSGCHLKGEAEDLWLGLAPRLDKTGLAIAVVGANCSFKRDTHFDSHFLASIKN